MFAFRTQRPRHGRAGLRLGALLLSAALASTAWAHDEPAHEPEPDVVIAIDASQIAAEADLVARAIHSFDQSLAPSATVAVIEERLPHRTAKIAAQEAQSPDWLDKTASLGTLSSAESAWEGLRPDLPDWLSELAARLGEVGDALAHLERMSEQWHVTEQELRAGDAPDALVASVVGVRANIAKARLRAAERRAALLTLQTAVAEQDGRIDRALEEVAAARESLVSRVFERDRLPISDARAFDRMGEKLGARVGELIAEGAERLDAFVSVNRGELTFHAALSALLLAALHLARTRVRRRTEEEQGLRRVADVFEVPYSVALLLAITASFSIYPYLPPSLVQLLGAVALLPTLRLVRRFTDRAFVPLLNALVGFYLLDRLRDLATSLPMLARVVFIGEMLAAVLLIGWLLRPARLQDIPAYAGRGTLYLLGLACRTALVVMLAALMAEALGYSLLGQLVGGAVLETAYVGVLAYAAVRIFDSLVTFALRVPPLGALGMVQRSRYAMSTQIHRIAVGVAVATWGWWSLDLFAIRGPIFSVAERVFTADLEIGTIALSLADLVAFAVTIWLAFAISRFVRFALEEDVYPRLKLARGIPYAASTFVHYTILGLGFFAAIAATGVDLNRFSLLLGAFGVGIGFGLQNVVNNFVSGLILLTERPVQVGDTIETEGLLGEVRRIGIRSSTVRTWNGAELIVPNGQLVSERVTNWTLSDRLRRISVTVGVAYGSDVDRVLALLREVAETNGDVLPAPAPQALFVGFGDSSLDFELRSWTTAFDDFIRVQSELNVVINRKLAEAEIEIPFPQRDLHLRSVDDAAGAQLGAGSETPPR